MDLGALQNNSLQFLFPQLSALPEETPATTDWLTLSKSEQNALDDLVRSGALALVFPKLDFAAFKNTALHFAQLFSIQPLNTEKRNPVSLEKALSCYALAEQEMIIKFLDKWIESEQKLATLAKEEQKRHDLVYFDTLKRTMQAYLQNQGATQQLSALPFTLLLSAFTIDSNSIIVTTKNLSSISVLTSAPPSLLNDLAAVSNGLLTLGLVWAAPTAITLGAGKEPSEFAKDGAKAFALAIAALVTSSEIDTLLSARFDAAIQAGAITPEQAGQMLSSCKASLLIQAAGALYRAEFGGGLQDEIINVIQGNKPFPENDFLNTLSKLIREQLANMNPVEAQKLVQECTAQYTDSSTNQGILTPLVQFLSLWDPSIYREASPA